MKKIICFKPLLFMDSFLEPLFEDFTNYAFGFNKKIEWQKYQELSNVSCIDFSLRYTNLTRLCDDLPEKLNLWETIGKEIGVENGMSFGEFILLLNKKELLLAPKATGIFLPMALKKQGITFEELKIASEPIPPKEGDECKSKGIILKKDKSNTIRIDSYQLRYTIPPFTPEDKFIIQKL
ncbi:MAG: hypothetical protein WC264_01245 [Candidatus Paceibacterota bacterium]|jgi:hypothetical protein